MKHSIEHIINEERCCNNNCNNLFLSSSIILHYYYLIFVNCDNDAKLVQAVVQRKLREYMKRMSICEFNIVNISRVYLLDWIILGNILVSFFLCLFNKSAIKR